MLRQRCQHTGSSPRFVSGVLVVLLLVSFSTLALAQESADTDADFPWAGEEVFFSISILGGEAARAALVAGEPTEDANLGRVIPIQGVAQSVGLAAAFARFKYEGLTYFNAATLLPVWGEKLLEDRGRSRTYETYYDRGAFTAEVTRFEDNRSSDWTTVIPAEVGDAFSWIYHLRQERLEVGDEYVYYIFDGWKLRRLLVRVAAHLDRPLRSGSEEQVRAAELTVIAEELRSFHALPWVEDDLRLPPVYTVRKRSELATAYMTVDDRRIPLGMTIATPIGTMRVSMDRYVPPIAER